MDRRAFLGTLALLAVPRVIEAQPSGKVARIGYLGNTGVQPRGYQRASSKDCMTSVTSRAGTSRSSTDGRRASPSGSPLSRTNWSAQG